MIFAKLEDAPRYRGVHPRLDAALALLTEEYLKTVTGERRLLEGEALTVTRFAVHTSDDEARLFEYHERYADIFITAAGEERVDTAESASMEVREQRGDYWGGVCKAEQALRLSPGSFLVLFPGEAHRPGMAVGRCAPIERIVFKVLIKEN